MALVIQCLDPLLEFVCLSGKVRMIAASAAQLVEHLPHRLPQLVEHLSHRLPQ